MREEPIWVARRMRWLSPPDRVAAARLRVRYWSPTLWRKPRRFLISLRMRSAMRCFWGVSSRPSTKARASFTDLRQKVSMLIPPTVTARASFRRRLPPQSGQGRSAMHSSRSRRMASLWVSR